MNRILVFLIALSVGICIPLTVWSDDGAVAKPAAAQPADKPTAKGLDGIWQGALKIGAIELRLVVKVTKKPDGSWRGTLDSPDQGAKGIVLDTVTLKDKDFHLEFKAGKATYDGKLNADSCEIVGEWKQAGQTWPLTFKHLDKEPEVRRPQEPKPPYPYLEEEVAYENKKAGVKLAGTLTRPRGQGPFAVALLITGSGPQDRDEAIFGHKPFKVLADCLTRRGVAVLRVDDRGVAKSTGDFAKATSLDFAEDVEAGIAYLKSRPDIDAKRIGLIGHSEGGFIAPLIASRSKDVAFIVMLAGPALNGEQILYIQGQAILKASGASATALARQRTLQETIFNAVRQEPDNAKALKKFQEALAEQTAKLTEQEKKEAEKARDGVEAQFKRVTTPWFRFFLTYDPLPALRKVSCPVLALNGEKDLQVDAKINLPAIAKALQEGGNKDYTIKELPKLNHLFQTCQTGMVSEYGKIEETFAPAALDVLADWVVKHTMVQGQRDQ
jgi:fermentation-respiration switch protein FrsA (DUF1100 family)